MAWFSASRDWRKSAFGDWTALYPAQHGKWPAEFDRIARAALQKNFTRVLRDTPRSLIALVKTPEGAPVVAKCPREKNTRRWIRLLSLLREGEAFCTARRMLSLSRTGIPVPEPLFALERRRGGMIVDSWYFYRYVEGRPCAEGELAAVIALLNRLHRTGRVHGDSNIENFLTGGDGTLCMIDCKTRRRLLGRFSDSYDFVLLANSRLAAARHPDFPPSSAYYLAALAFNRAVRGWRKIKKKLRGRPRD